MIKYIILLQLCIHINAFNDNCIYFNQYINNITTVDQAITVCFDINDFGLNMTRQERKLCMENNSKIERWKPTIMDNYNYIVSNPYNYIINLISANLQKIIKAIPYLDGDTADIIPISNHIMWGTSNVLSNSDSINTIITGCFIHKQYAVHNTINIVN